MLQPGTWVEIRPGARLWPEMELNEWARAQNGMVDGWWSMVDGMVLYGMVAGPRGNEIPNWKTIYPSSPAGTENSPLEAPTPAALSLNNVAACALNQHVAISEQFVIL